MVFDTLQVKAVEGLLANDQPEHQHGVGGKERLGESKMNNLKRQKQRYLTKVTFYSSTNL